MHLVFDGIKGGGRAVFYSGLVFSHGRFPHGYGREGNLFYDRAIGGKRSFKGDP